MAQPQHTRNDSHGPWWLGAGGGSLYERQTEDYHTRLPLLGYPPVYGADDQTTFSAPRRFWTHGGKALADYSNRGFVSAGKNFSGDLSNIQSAPGFPSPNGSTASLSRHLIEDPDLLGPDQPLRGAMYFVETPVVDQYRQATPTEINTRTSTLSIFDAELLARAQPATFTLNRFNFEAAWQFLIPRAVGYSAGLLNYFFRGRLEFARDPETPGNYVIKNVGPDDLTGDFQLFAEDQYGTRQAVTPGADWAQRSVPKGGKISVSGFTPLPTGRQYVLVFRGQMGQETDAVAAKVLPAKRWLLMGFNASYQGHPDGGWQQVDTGPLKQDASSGSNDFFNAATFVNDDLLFVRAGVFEYGLGLPLWRSTDGGQHFTDITANFPGREAGQFLSSVTWLGGTELLAGFYRRSPTNEWDTTSLPRGTLYSADLGQSWEAVGPEQWAWGDGPGVLYVGRNGPGEPVVLLSGTSGGLLQVSTDRGATWTALSGADAFQCAVTTMAWNQVEGAGSVILAGTACGPGSVWRSTDQGQSWTMVRPQLQHWALEGQAYGDWPIAVAISPQNEVLLTVEHFYREKTASGWHTRWAEVLYHSLDAGDTWEVAADPTGTPNPYDTWTPPGLQALGVAYLGGPGSIP